ncbi:ribosomal protein L24 [Sulfolobus islandicus Y.G.57.14]|jgi:large subunit ribosomal protein L24|uniref:Large ribosomal subunit protein uL24 n=3 Tax=Saccharolobus islandicus TaxID=43080 RepID=C3NEF4_SACI7|nr:50S ribosomal protein L24 [Sulfolobus islandicus]ACP45693.1 ribosomal protein L24 [Sulfolobus islandicus Y.G.57.14]ACP48508.1 ribosomal protein L24 [Sulfolobus islandicus Y.N.15.51]ADB87302.1 ribosomal protein L24 [Sulfolobus islandicus L.D.8.5]
MVSLKPSKQRRLLHTLPLHQRKKLLIAKVSDEIASQYGIKRIRVRKGDTVRVMRGNHNGKEGKVTEINTRTGRLAIEGITRKKADGTPVYVWIHASKVMITKLDLSDPRRREKLEKSKK